jgi:hypothetical protein
MGQPTEEQPPIVGAEDVDRRYLIQRMTLEAGWLGKIFGSSTNAPTNIAGFVVGFLTIAIVVIGILFVPSSIPPSDFLNMVIPVVTLALGYVFGKST